MTAPRPPPQKFEIALAKELAGLFSLEREKLRLSRGELADYLLANVPTLRRNTAAQHILQIENGGVFNRIKHFPRRLLDGVPQNGTLGWYERSIADHAGLLNKVGPQYANWLNRVCELQPDFRFLSTNVLPYNSDLSFDENLSQVKHYLG